MTTRGVFTSAAEARIRPDRFGRTIEAGESLGGPGDGVRQDCGRYRANLIGNYEIMGFYHGINKYEIIQIMHNINHFISI